LCAATDAVGDVVRFSGDKVGNRYQVTKVNIDSLATMPAIGVILRKTSATECEVQTSGALKGVYSGLTPNLTLFIGTDSRLTHTVTPQPTTGPRAHQIMGVASATTEVLLGVKSPIILTT
jgi:hypothetical protein